MGRIEQLMSFVEQHPEDPFPRYGLALELKNGGRLEDAERAFAELLEKFPEYTPAYLHAGNALAELGRRGEAIEIYRKGIEACERRRPVDEHARSELQAALASLLGPEGPESEVKP
jgi:tetratricopeptide (TPR) repeat protein